MQILTNHKQVEGYKVSTGHAGTYKPVAYFLEGDVDGYSVRFQFLSNRDEYTVHVYGDGLHSQSDGVGTSRSAALANWITRQTKGMAYMTEGGKVKVTKAITLMQWVLNDLRDGYKDA